MGWFDSVGKAFSSAGNFVAKTATQVANTTLHTIETGVDVAGNVGKVALHQVENIGKVVVEDVGTVFTKPQNLFSNIQRQLQQQGKLITNDWNKIILPKIVNPVIHQAEEIGSTALKVVEPVINPVEKVLEPVIKPVYNAVIKPIEKEIEKIISPEPVKVNVNKLIVDNLEEPDYTIYYLLGGIGALLLLTKK